MRRGVIIFQSEYSTEFDGTLVRYETSSIREDRVDCTFLPYPTATENQTLDYPWSSFEESKVLDAR